MDAHEYDEGPSPRAQDRVESQAKRLGISEEKAWEIYYSYYKRGRDGDAFAGLERSDFHDEDEGEAEWKSPHRL